MTMHCHTPAGRTSFASGVPRYEVWLRRVAWCLGTGLLSVMMLAAGSLVRANTATLSVIVPKPYITSLTPSTIRAEGTAVVAVSGTGFTSSVYTIEQVTLDGIPAASFTVEGPDSLTFVTPRLTAGQYDVVLTTSTGLVSEPTAAGNNVLSVTPGTAPPSPSPSPSASPVLLQATPTPSLSPSPNPPPTASPRPAGHHHRTIPQHQKPPRKPSSGVGAVVQTVTHFIQHHVVVVSSSVIVVLLLLLTALLLVKRRKRKPDLESRLKL